MFPLKNVARRVNKISIIFVYSNIGYAQLYDEVCCWSATFYFSILPAEYDFHFDSPP